MPVYIKIIVGKANSRKSSTIRALTGIGQPNFYDIALFPQGVQQDTLVINSAIQEGCRLSPTEFIRHINNNLPFGRIARYPASWSTPDITSATKHILIGLRENPLNGCLDALAYIDAFCKAGWFFQPNTDVVYLNRAAMPVNLPFQHHAINDVVHIPSNQIAHQVRNLATWQWL